jgi:putative heme-binding domain-containing protein
MDDSLAYALAQAVYALKPHWLPAFQAGKLDFGNRLNRLEFVLKADGSPDTFQALSGLLDSEQLSPETRESFWRIFVEVAGPKDLARALQPASFTSAAGYQSGLQARTLTSLMEAGRFRPTRPEGNLEEAVSTLLERSEEPVRAAALRLAGHWKLAALSARLQEVARSPRESEALRLAAMEGLASLGGEPARQTLLAIAGAGAGLPRSIQAAAVAALTAVDLKAAATSAASILATDISGTSATNLVAAFLQRKQGGAALAQALEMKPPARDAARLGLRWMHSVGRRDAGLEEILTQAAGIKGEPVKLSPAEVTAFVTEIRAQGDPVRGQQIFQRPELSCLSCHSVNDQGGHVGPDLNAIGSGQPLDFIIGAVLEPAKEVKEGFEAIEVLTKDDESYQGYRLREDGNELVLRDVLQNRPVRIPKSNIASVANRGSLMPPGLLDSLTRAEMRDLFRYLSDLGKPR